MKDQTGKSNETDTRRFADYRLTDFFDTQNILAARAEQLGPSTSNGKRPHLKMEPKPSSPNVARAWGMSEQEIEKLFPGIKDGTQRWTNL